MEMQDYLAGWLDGTTEPPAVTRLIGIRLLEAGEGRARLTLTTGPQHYNPMQIVHGGILCDLADAAMGVALASALESGESFTTVQLGIQYFRSLREGSLVAAGHIVRRGSNVGYIECEIEDEAGRLVAKASSTCFITRSGPVSPGS
jgi:uncharacterized protein (TIGR00369 family)